MAKEPTQRILSKKHLARLERERIQQRYLIIAIAVVAALVLGIILYGILDQTVIKNIKPVAKVGNTNISTAAFQKEVRFQRSQLINQLSQFASNQLYLQFYGSYAQQLYQELNTPATIGQNVIDSMVENELVKREAEKRGITVTKEELDQAFEEAFGFYANGTQTPTVTATSFSTSTLSPEQLAFFPPTNTPGPTEVPTIAETPATPTAEFTATPEATAAEAVDQTPTPDYTPTITSTPTPYTRDEFKKNVATYVSGLDAIKYSENDLRELIRRQLLKKKVYDAITADVESTAEQVWARHILTPSEDLAVIALDRLKAGESFASVASEVSTDTSNKDQGGDLGWFTRGQMVAPFEEAAFSMKVGEISQPVKTDFGFHVIQVLGKEVRPLTAAQMDTARQKLYKDWLDQAKKDNNVQTFDSWVDAVPTEPTLAPELQSVLTQYLQQPTQDPFQGLNLETIVPSTPEATPAP